jgi:hypothetical protein
MSNQEFVDTMISEADPNSDSSDDQRPPGPRPI